MPAEHLTGAPFNQQAVVYVQTDIDYTLGNDDDVVEAVSEGQPALTVTLPPQPVPGQRHTIIANGFAVAVSGNGHTLAGLLDNVPNGVAATYVFAANGTTGLWVAGGLATT